MAVAKDFNRDHSQFSFQAASEADQELRRVPHRPRLLDREDLPGPEASAANRDDERLPQLPGHLLGPAHGGPGGVQVRRDQHHRLQTGRSGEAGTAEGRAGLDLRGDALRAKARRRLVQQGTPSGFNYRNVNAIKVESINSTTIFRKRFSAETADRIQQGNISLWTEIREIIHFFNLISLSCPLRLPSLTKPE